MDLGHVASATLVGFARGLDDRPKILGLLIGLQIFSPGAGTVALAWVATLPLAAGLGSVLMWSLR